MAAELGPFLIKLAGVVVTLAKEPVLKNEHVVRLLKKFGYERLKDEFDTLYVNALVLRRLDGRLRLSARATSYAELPSMWRKRPEASFRPLAS